MDMVKAALAFLLACFITLQLHQLPSFSFYAVLVVLIPLFLLLRQITFTIFIIGLLWSGYNAALRLDDRLDKQFDESTLLVKGQILSLPEQQSDRLRFIFEPESEQLPHHIQLSWYYAEQMPKAGEIWQFLIKLKSPHSLSNPGGFDYERWLFEHDIGATGYIKTSQQNKLINHASLFNIQHWRQTLSDDLNTHLANHPFKAFIMGLSLGNRSELSPEHWQVLQKTGTSHLMAISGLHIGLAALFMFFIGRWLWSCSTQLLLMIPAQQAAAVMALIAATCYAVLAGLSIPTQRALIMTLTVLAGILLNRRFFSHDILALSLIFILIHDPFAVLSAGFWLSFFAVALIFFLSQHRFPQPKQQWLTIHLWLAVGLAPLTLLFFHQVSLISPIANLLAVPLVSFIIVPLCLVAMGLLVLFPTASEFLFLLADKCLSYLWTLLDYLANAPVSSWQSAALPDWVILLLIPMLAFLLLPRAVPARWLGVIFLFPALMFQTSRPPKDQFELAVLDVGQGLAAVVSTAEHTLLFDSGRYYSKRFDMGRSVVVPYLKQHDIHQLDTFVISHDDIDHSGGAASVLAAMPTKRILSSDIKHYPQASLCQTGQYWHWDGVDFEVLNPGFEQVGSDNNRSCVVRVSSPNMSVLLTGDIEHDTEAQLLQTQFDKLATDILVVPHHGSRSSSGEAFIQAVSPAIASISVGYRNAYGFPTDEVIARYQKQGSAILRTDVTGAQIYYYLPNKGMQVTQWRDINHRLWSTISTE